MSDFEVTMLYELPVSKEKYTVTLLKEEDLYKDSYLEYKIPIDTWITKEAGIIKFMLSLTKVEVGGNNKIIQHVRKVTGGKIEIASSKDWGSELADGLLQAVDQRIVQLQMVAQQIDEANQELYDLCNGKADNLSYEENQLQLTSNGQKIGNPVSIYDIDPDEDGNIIVVEF